MEYIVFVDEGHGFVKKENEIEGMSPAAGSVVPPPPSTGPMSTSLLDRALVRGLAWTGTVKWGSQLLAWGATLFVARVLVPADYGMFAMATVYVGFVSLLSEFGFGSAVVVLRDLRDEQVKEINTLSLVFGGAAFALSCAAAIPLGRFFKAPGLPPVVIAMSTAFLITAFRAVPHGLLQKDLRFKLLAFVDGAQMLAASFSMVVFAMLGFGYWTLVLGGLLGAVVSTVLVLMSRRHGFAWPRLRSSRDVITFSWRIVVTRFSFYLYSSADLFVAGKTLPRTMLGSYSFAVTLATLYDKVLALMASVTPSILSSVQTQAASLRRYLLSLTEGVALITFPTMLGLAAVADVFVLAALGEKWRPMIAPLRVLAAYAGFRSIAALPGQLLNVIGEVRFSMWVQLVAVVTLPFAFYVGSRWGAVGIAAAWVVVHPLVNLPLYHRVFRKIGLSARQYLEALSPALTGSSLMLVAILGVDRVMPSAWPPVVVLIVQVLTGALTYVLALLTLKRDRVRIFCQTLKLLRH